MRLVVALTGGIGSGKSTVADVFAVLGAAVVDTDVIAHELTAAQGRAIPEIAAAFGSDVLRPDGALDRAAMRHLVFSDVSVKDRLEVRKVGRRGGERAFVEHGCGRGGRRRGVGSCV